MQPGICNMGDYERQMAPCYFVWVPLDLFMDRAKPVSTRGASVLTTATTLGGVPGAREQQSEILCLSYRVERSQTIKEYFRQAGNGRFGLEPPYTISCRPPCVGNRPPLGFFVC